MSRTLSLGSGICFPAGNWPKPIWLSTRISPPDFQVNVELPGKATEAATFVLRSDSRTGRDRPPVGLALTIAIQVPKEKIDLILKDLGNYGFSVEPRWTVRPGGVLVGTFEFSGYLEMAKYATWVVFDINNVVDLIARGRIGTGEFKPPLC
jgi:hypothetical protein